MFANGRLFHSFRQDKLKAPATSADYANMISAAMALHHITGEKRYLDDAIAWTGFMNSALQRGQRRLFSRRRRHERPYYAASFQAGDEAVPNPNATMLQNLADLYTLTGDTCYLTRADALLAAFQGAARTARDRLYRPAIRRPTLISPQAHCHRGRQVCQRRGTLAEGVVRSLASRCYRAMGWRQRGDPSAFACCRERQHRRQDHRLCLRRPALLHARNRTRAFEGKTEGRAVRRGAGRRFANLRLIRFSVERLKTPTLSLSPKGERTLNSRCGLLRRPFSPGEKDGMRGSKQLP